MDFVVSLLPLAFAIKSISFMETGLYHNCVYLLDRNETKCWAYNEYGQLGCGDTNNRGDGDNQMGDKLSEVDLGTGFIPTQIAAGWQHTCALSTDNKVKCWGGDNYCELGYGDGVDLGTGFIPTQIAAGWQHTCALSTDNKIKCFGGNTYGELGYGDGYVDLGIHFIPIQIAAGREHTCALSTYNKIKCWGCCGAKAYGQLGYGDLFGRGLRANEMGDDLLEIDLGTGFIPSHITAGYYHTCALSIATNKVKCWGLNWYGLLGYGVSKNRGDRVNEMGDNLPHVDLGIHFISKFLTAGYYHSCALSIANTVKCWGYNAMGQLGIGDTNTRGDEANEMGDHLLEIDLGTNFIPMQIVAGADHTCALSTANKAKCWGYNLFG
eukprot:949780_1